MDEITKKPDDRGLDLTEEYNGKPRYKVMKNGAIRDAAVNKIVRGATWSRADALALHERRVSLAREATRQGITSGLGLDARKAGTGEEWKLLTEHFVEQFKKSKNLRGMAESYDKLGRAAGYMSAEPESSAAEQILQSFAQLMQDFISRDDVVEGEVRDG